MKFIKKLLACVLIILSVAGLTAFGVSRYYKENPEIKYVQKEGEKEYIYTYQEITGEEIETGIRNISELHTSSYNFTRVQKFYEAKRLDFDLFGIDINWEVIGTKKSFSFSYDGKVTAGIEFDKVKVNKDEDNKIIYIELPEPVLFDPVIDTSSYEFYEITNSLLNPIDPKDYAVALDELVKAEMVNAENSTLLKDAEDNAKQMVESFVKGIASNYKIEFIDDIASI